MKIFRSLALLAALAVSALSLAACGTGIGAADPAASSASAAGVTSHFKADLATGYGALAAIEVGAKVALQGGYLTNAQVDGFIAQRAAFKKALDDLVVAGDSPSSQTTLATTLAAINAAQAIIKASQGVPKS